MINKLLVVIAILLISVIVLATKLSSELNKTLKINNEQLLTVTKGSSISSFSAMLERKGWITNRFWLRNYGRLFPSKAKIKAGTYQIVQGVTLQKLLEQVVEGKEHQFSITFIEGTRFKDALVTLSNHPYVEQTLQGDDVSNVAKILGIEAQNPEGWLFPDTYAFTAGTSDLALLKRAYANMKEQLNRHWQARDSGLPYETPYEALIMASIIEKETSYVAEQPMISSVFVNRLRKNMRLQTDPTIIYGLGERYKGDITRAHKREKTAYNTYRINGLPPTPIALTGLSAIQATLHPAQSDFFYFVSDAEGKHVFSKSLKEHNAAVKRYLQKYRERHSSH